MEQEKKYAAKEIEDNQNKVNIHLTLEEKMKNNPGPFIGLNFVQVKIIFRFKAGRKRPSPHRQYFGPISTISVKTLKIILFLLHFQGTK